MIWRAFPRGPRASLHTVIRRTTKLAILCAGYRKRIADLVVIVLGTNDLKQMFNRTPLRIAIGAAHLIDLVNTLNGGVGTTYKNPKVLLICPPLLNPEVGSSAGEA